METAQKTSHDPIPQSVLEEIIRKGITGPMYKHEMVQMAYELQDLRIRFNKKEDLTHNRILDAESAWSRMLNMPHSSTIVVAGPFDPTRADNMEWAIHRSR